jgi:hypothetical protein
LNHPWDKGHQQPWPVWPGLTEAHRWARSAEHQSLSTDAVVRRSTGFTMASGSLLYWQQTPNLTVLRLGRIAKLFLLIFNFLDFPHSMYQLIVNRLLAKQPQPVSLRDPCIYSTAAICVVKDEAPYLHEYIHHHLYFGFSKVLILVNRTTDDSLRVLNRICSHYPSVQYFNLDWADYISPGPQIQFLGYAYGIALLRSISEIRYALLNDADEFWFPSDFETTIDNWLQSLPTFDQISICWAKQQTHESEFEPPFQNRKVHYSNQVKSIVNIYSSISRVHMHRCSFSGGGVKLDSRGSSFIEDSASPNRFCGEVIGHPAYILHRMQRSRKELESIILRGNPEKIGAKKQNRREYLNSFSTMIEIQSNLYELYQSSLNSFVKECCLEQVLGDCRRKVIERTMPTSIT